MGFLGNIIKKISTVSSDSEELVLLRRIDNNKALLDIAIRLYDAEVLRYRWIEDKATKILSIVIFLTTSATVLVSWLATINDDGISFFIIIAIGIVAGCSVPCTLSVIEVLGENDESLSLISLPNINANNIDDSDKYYSDFYGNLLNKHNDLIGSYKELNAKKINSVNHAYKWLLLLLFYVAILVVIISLYIFLGSDFVRTL